MANYKHVILFNGPPRVGKDTAASMSQTFCRFNYIKNHRVSIATSLKNATHALFGLNVEAGHYELQKKTPLPEFFGETPRQSYINVSEHCIKPFYGPNFFADVAVNHMKRLPSGIIIVPDCGFQAEIDGTIKAFGIENVRLVRIYREGESFEKYGDSRSYLSIDKERDFDLHNNGTLVALQNRIDILCKQFIDEWGVV